MTTITTLRKAAAKRTTRNCNCGRYSFPHRPGGGNCMTPDFINIMRREHHLIVDQQQAEDYMNEHGRLHKAIAAYLEEDSRPEALTAAQRNR